MGPHQKISLTFLVLLFSFTPPSPQAADFQTATFTGKVVGVSNGDAISNMLKIEALRELPFEKCIITEDEFIAKFKKPDREMKAKGS